MIQMRFCSKTTDLCKIKCFYCACATICKNLYLLVRLRCSSFPKLFTIYSFFMDIVLEFLSSSSPWTSVWGYVSTQIYTVLYYYTVLLYCTITHVATFVLAYRQHTVRGVFTCYKINWHFQISIFGFFNQLTIWGTLTQFRIKLTLAVWLIN